MTNLSDYIEGVISKGDEGSALLHALTAPTLENNETVTVRSTGMGGVATVTIPDGYKIVVHSAIGNPKYDDLEAHAASMVRNLVIDARRIGAMPIAFANTIDSATGDTSDLRDVAKGLVREANKYGLAILNGENAILGAMLGHLANVSGTMLSVVDKVNYVAVDKFERDGVTYATFDPLGDPVMMNCDGVGTKTLLHARSRNYGMALHDSLAMKLDDASKFGAQVQVVADVVEWNRRSQVAMERVNQELARLQKRFSNGDSLFTYILQQEHVGDRVCGYARNAMGFTVNGTAVSTLMGDDEFVPKWGDSLVVVASKTPNPRSNGISAKRRAAARLGEKWLKSSKKKHWHQTKEGKDMLAYLSAPSAIFYDFFDGLLMEGEASAVFHMSGGAYDGKLARPIAKQGLFVSINGLFRPDKRELALLGSDSVENAYGSWPMGNDAFVTTSDPSAVIRRAKAAGYKAKEVGNLVKNSKTGVELTAFNGEKVYFRGK